MWRHRPRHDNIAWLGTRTVEVGPSGNFDSYWAATTACWKHRCNCGVFRKVVVAKTLFRVYSGTSILGSKPPHTVRSLKRILYSSVGSPRRRYREAIASQARDGQKILDLGCGYTAPDLVEVGVNRALKIGTDIVDGQRASAVSEIHYVCSDCYHLAFESNAFDLVICRSVLEHLEHPKRAFDEISRVLTQGGTFVFLTPNRWDYVSLAASVTPNRYHAAVVRRLTGRDEQDTFPTFYRANTARRIRTFAEQAGLRMIWIEFLREHPHYLRSNRFAYVAGVAFEQIVQRPVKWLRPWILGICRCES